MIYEEWAVTLIPFESKSMTRKEIFAAGAASRDAEIQRLQMALADTEALEIGTAEKCGQLREQVQLLREALEYSVKQVPELGTVPGIANALADTESKP